MKNKTRTPGVTVETVCASAKCHPSVWYRILDGSLKGSTKLKRLYEELGLDVAMINRHEEDVEDLIRDFYAIKLAAPELAARHVKEVHQHGVNARAYLDEEDKLQRKREQFVRSGRAKRSE